MARVPNKLTTDEEAFHSKVLGRWITEEYAMVWTLVKAESEPSILAGRTAYWLREYATWDSPDWLNPERFEMSYWFDDDEMTDIEKRDRYNKYVEEEKALARRHWMFVFTYATCALNHRVLINSIAEFLGPAGIDRLADTNKLVKQYMVEFMNAGGTPIGVEESTAKLLVDSEKKFLNTSEWLFVIANRFAPEGKALLPDLPEGTIVEQLFDILNANKADWVSFNDLYDAWDDVPLDGSIDGRLKALREKLDPNQQLTISRAKRRAMLH